MPQKVDSNITLQKHLTFSKHCTNIKRVPLPPPPPHNTKSEKRMGREEETQTKEQVLLHCQCWIG